MRRRQLNGWGPPTWLFEPDHHGFGADEMLDACVAEAGLFHPADAINPGVVEPARCFDEHVQAHEKTEGILGAVVVDDALVDNQRTAFGNGVIRFPDKHLFGVEIPVVQDVAHQDDVRLRDGGVEPAAGLGPRRQQSVVRRRIP